MIAASASNAAAQPLAANSGLSTPSTPSSGDHGSPVNKSGVHRRPQLHPEVAQPAASKTGPRGPPPGLDRSFWRLMAWSIAHGVDWLLFSASLIIWACVLALPDARVQVLFPTDPTLWAPVAPSSSVPIAVVYCLGMLALCSIVVFEVLLRHPRESLYSALQRGWFLGFNGVCAFWITVFLTEVCKVYVGNFRPDFVTRCYSGTGLLSIPTNYTAIGLLDCPGDPGKVEDGRRSFMSGHASSSASFALFFALYLAWKTKHMESRLVSQLSMLVGGAGLVLALYVSMSRIIDYRHHPADVVGGVVVALLFNLWMWRYCEVQAECRFKQYLQPISESIGLELQPTSSASVSPKAAHGVSVAQVPDCGGSGGGDGGGGAPLIEPPSSSRLSRHHSLHGHLHEAHHQHQTNLRMVDRATSSSVYTYYQAAPDTGPIQPPIASLTTPGVEPDLAQSLPAQHSRSHSHTQAMFMLHPAGGVYRRPSAARRQFLPVAPADVAVGGQDQLPLERLGDDDEADGSGGISRVESEYQLPVAPAPGVQQQQQHLLRPLDEHDDEEKFAVVNMPPTPQSLTAAPSSQAQAQPQMQLRQSSLVLLSQPSSVTSAMARQQQQPYQNHHHHHHQQQQQQQLHYHQHQRQSSVGSSRSSAQSAHVHARTGSSGSHLSSGSPGRLLPPVGTPILQAITPRSRSVSGVSSTTVGGSRPPRLSQS